MGEWSAWTSWKPETHTSWELSEAPLGQPAAHSSGSSHGLKWERQWQAQFDGQTRQAESGTRVETSEWVKSAPDGDGWTQIDTRQVETKPEVPAKWQANDPEAACFNGPEKPAPLSGVEERTGDPVCVTPLNGTATVTSEQRSWSQLPEWSLSSKKWEFAPKTFGEWAKTGEQTVDSQSCIPGAPEPKNGTEQRTTDPVCVDPLNGTANVATESRAWTQTPSWDAQVRDWIFGNKVFGDWEVLSTETVGDAECAPEPPEKLTGTETQNTDPVCVEPNNGTAKFDTQERNWTQTPVWSSETLEWIFGEKEYTEWVVVKTTTVDSESCSSDEPEDPETPQDKLERTGTSNNIWLYSGGSLLLSVGILALMLGFATRKHRVE